MPVRPQLQRFKGWKVSGVEPGDHGWKITLEGNNEPGEDQVFIHTGKTPIKENVIKKIVGQRLQTIIMDSQNTQVYFGDRPIVFNALDYRVEIPDYNEGERFSPQWPEEREAIGEMPPELGEQ